MESSVQDADLPEGWMMCHSKSLKGKVYYFNTLTGESLWEHPEAILHQDQEKKTEVAVTSQQKDVTESSAKKPKTENWPEGLWKSGNGPKADTEARPSLGKHNELKLRPIVKVLKKTKNSLKMDFKGSKVEKSMATKNAVKLKDALSFLADKTEPVNIRFKTAQNLKNQSNNCIVTASNSDTSHSSLARELGQKTTGKGIPNCNLEKSSKSICLKKGDTCIKNQNGKRTLQPLRPLKKTHKTEENIKSSDNRTPIRSIEIPKKPQNSFYDNRERKDSMSSTSSTSASDRHFFTTDQRNPTCRSQTVKSVVSPSNPSPPSYITSDVVMSGMPVRTTVEPETNQACTVEGGQNMNDIEEEDMEVDDFEFMSNKILKQIESIRVERIEVPKMLSENTESTSIKEGSLFIVLDTNILLSHLKLVRELKDSPIPGAGRPTIIIPWMVNQELDRLKTAPDSRINESGNGKPRISVNILARKAISFLNNCFAESHPRIRGQTVYEANQHIEGLVEESNDDNILHCCLLLKAKAPQAKIVLLSNDRNLCNKALVNDVKAFDSKMLISGLRDLFQMGNLLVHRDHFQEYYKVAETQEFLAEKRRKADDLICEVQCILREAFAAVVEKEMKEAFDEHWLVIVKIKPPWTLIDTLELLEKHWIAVFGMIVDRRLSASVSDLKRKFSSGDAVLRNLDKAGQLIELGYTICSAFSKHSDYDNVLPKCMAALIVLQKEYNEFSKKFALARPANLALPLPASESAAGQGNQRNEDILECVANVLHKDPSTAVENQAAGTNIHFAVMSSFDEIWKAVRVLSSCVFRSLDYPNPYESEGNQMTQQSSREEALRFLHQFIPCLSRLVQAIQKLVACSMEFSMENAAIFTELGESIAQFMKAMMCRDCHITFDELRAFCMDSFCRSALVQGLSQLDRALAVLQHCSSFASTTV